MKEHVSSDHVHLFVSIPPQVTISRLVQWLKGRTSHHLLGEFAHLRKGF
jgi:putative transposase